MFSLKYLLFKKEGKGSERDIQEQRRISRGIYFKVKWVHQRRGAFNVA